MPGINGLILQIGFILTPTVAFYFWTSDLMAAVWFFGVFFWAVDTAERAIDAARGK